MTIKYKPEFARQVTKYAELGATNRMLGAVFDVHEDTITRWRKRYPEFGEAIEKAKAVADIQVEDALFKMATGYSYTVEEAKVTKDAQGNEHLESISLTKYETPKIQAIQFWLKNRRPELWRDRTELEHGGLDMILAEIMNTSRGLPRRHSTAMKHIGSYAELEHYQVVEDRSGGSNGGTNEGADD